MSRSVASTVPSGWTAVVAADRAFFDSNEAEGATAIAFPDALAPREVPLTGDEVVIGRRSEAKGFFPGIDLSLAPFPEPPEHAASSGPEATDPSPATIPHRKTCRRGISWATPRG